MIIRDATDEDLAHTGRIVHECWEEFYPPMLGREKVEAMARARKANPRTKASPGTLVAEVDGRVAGMCYYDDEKGEVVALYIDPKDTGRGIGAALIREAIRRLSAKFDVVKCSTLVGNHRALKFYKREGFAEVGRGIHTHLGVAMDVVRLEKRLR